MTCLDLDAHLTLALATRALIEGDDTPRTKEKGNVYITFRKKAKKKDKTKVKQRHKSLPLSNVFGPKDINMHTPKKKTDFCFTLFPIPEVNGVLELNLFLKLYWQKKETPSRKKESPF